MSSLTPRIDAVESHVGAEIQLEYQDVPNTTISNRAQMAKYWPGKPLMGVERTQTQEIRVLRDEYGTTDGAAVYKHINDKFDQVRFVGNWNSAVTADGSRVRTDTADSYMEISFYGTGLNILVGMDSVLNDLRVTEDGGTEGANIFPTGSSGVLRGRNYSANQVLNVSSKLTQTLHTVRIRSANSVAFVFYGFEVLNETTDILVPGFTRPNNKTYADTNLPFNSSFESGAIGTRGGRALIYAKPDGSVRHSVQPTDVTQQNLSSADHTNEELISTHFWREFGSGRSDDFSLIDNTASDVAFTLDDGTTTTVGNEARRILSPGVGVNSVGDYWTFTFIGTGLDITGSSNVSSPIDDHEVFINGTSVGSVPTLTEPIASRVSIVSGLPYGTHTVQIKRNVTATGAFIIYEWLVYGPKKPSLPAGDIELGEYFILADFVANSTVDDLYISTGTVRKSHRREWVYLGVNMQLDLNVVLVDGGRVREYTANTSSGQLTFMGEGFDFRTKSSGGNASTSVFIDLHDGNGFTLLTDSHPDANVQAAATAATTYGTGIGFTPSTGILDLNDGSSEDGVGFTVTGLPYQLYTIKFESTDNIQLGCIDVINPIYYPVLNGPCLIQNTLRVGSCSIRDLRKVDISNRQYVLKTTGITPSPTTTKVGDTDVIPDIQGSFVVEEDGNYEVTFWGIKDQASINSLIIINSKAQATGQSENTVNPGMYTYSEVFALTKGEYHAHILWERGAAGATARLNGTNRFLTVKRVD